MILRILLAISFILLFDLYAYQTVKTLTIDLQPATRKILRLSFWLLSLILYTFLVLFAVGVFAQAGRTFIVMFSSLFFAMFLTKLMMMIPLIVEDVYRIFHKIITFIGGNKLDISNDGGGFLVSRKKFIAQISAGLGGLTFMGINYGVMKGAHDYKMHKADVALKGLPAGFRGLRIGQLSDIHSGSFWDKESVRRGVEKMMREKPDIFFFTGDLVNSLADEMTEDYIEIFRKIKAPMGVYSILGNHDYGDYHNWPDKDVIQMGNHSQSNRSHMSPMQLANLEKLKGVHKRLGWDLLLNENRILRRGDDEIALIGVENYGAKGRFAKYGILSKACEGTDQYPVKILLTHDPSHWEAQVLRQNPGIGLTLSGHTHGAQFGIETAGFKWSPIKYLYKQWAGLYTIGEQHLYVNRGFGYLGYPGRLGIKPELTVLTLV